MGMTALPELVRPFVGARFAGRHDVSALISPPYDVISPSERSALAAQSSANIVHLTLPAGAEDRYDSAARLLRMWREDGTLERDGGPSVRVLRERFRTPDGAEHVRSGMIAGVCAEPYSRGRVRPHERTHKGPKEDRLKLLRATRTVLEPLFFLARDGGGGLLELLRTEAAHRPDVEASLGGVQISVWVVPAERAAGALASLRAEPLYIADGHHRYETAAAYAEEQPDADWTMGFIAGATDPGVVVLPTHRVIVSNADRHALEQVVAAVAEPTAKGDHDCTVVWPDGRDVAVRLHRDGGPDGPLVALVERLLVTPLLATSAGSELVYTHEEDDARSRAANGVALLVRPTVVEEVLSVADAGGTMPPKSTFFYPKVPSGIVLGPLA